MPPRCVCPNHDTAAVLTGCNNHDIVKTVSVHFSRPVSLTLPRAHSPACRARSSCPCPQSHTRSPHQRVSQRCDRHRATLSVTPFVSVGIFLGHVSTRGRIVPSPGPAGGGISAKNRRPRRQKLGPGTQGGRPRPLWGTTGLLGDSTCRFRAESQSPWVLAHWGRSPNQSKGRGTSDRDEGQSQREARRPRSGAGLRAHGRGKGRDRRQGTNAASGPGSGRPIRVKAGEGHETWARQTRPVTATAPGRR